MKNILILILLFFNNIYAQDIKNQYPIQKVIIGDFITSSGDTINGCFLTYRSFGKLNTDSSNIIFFPTWLGGNSENIGTLLSKYSFIDTNKFYIISIDALGNGFSSSPSNNSNQKSFPKITFDDLTKAYYKVLKEWLKLEKVYAIVGGSMGGMTAFEFAIKYPHFAEKIVSYVSTPKLSSYDLLWTSLQINLIEHLKKLNSPERNIKAYSDMITALISRTPEYFNETIKIADFENYFNKFYKEPDSVYTLDNYLTQMKAIVSYDLTKYFGEDLEELAKRVKAKLLIIVSESDMMVNSKNAIKFAEYSNSEVLVLKNNCGHMGVNCEMEKVKEIINNFLSNNN